ncbi:obscurin-like protein 1 isoform X2 [Mytilus edulis]|uniref:obscurin-like protein 1 isoform X2 n=2 Tax=Mytilus edulis TaxID=6550 RepID=UPI0039EE0704
MAFKVPTLTFLRLLRDEEVLEGHDVQFECEVTKSKLEGKWYKDGTELHEYPDMNIQNIGRKRRLQIYATSLQDTGVYSCEVNNIKTKAFLDVKAYFTRTLRNKNCSEGDTVTFVCEVKESDTVAQCKKDGINVKHNRYNIKQMGKTHQLTILDVNHCDNGCFTVDVNGRIREASLNVKACFMTDPNSISCTEGENVTFLCELHTTKEPIVWFHGSLEISTSDKYHVRSQNRKTVLEIKNVSTEDSEEITVRVKNCTRKCSLIVSKYFLRQLESKTVREGCSAQFHCEVSCQDDVGTWYKDDEKVISSKKFDITKSGKINILVLNDTSIVDSGEYSFNVHNHVTKSSLLVEGYFIKNPRNITREGGETVYLTCETREISSPVKWYKEGIDIDVTNGKFSIQQNRNQYQLAIQNVNKMDSGWYSVNVTGRKRTARVTVKDFFTKPLKDIICHEGDNIKFSCKSIEPASPAKWSKNNDVICNSRCILEHMNYVHKLKIQNVKPSDSGHYCINVNGKTNYFKGRPKDITCKKGDTVRFECEAMKHGMEVKWFKDDKNINPDQCIVEQKGQIYQLTINNVDTMDNGRYTISVNGRTRTAFLKIEDYSTMMLNYITCKKGEIARFKCEATENGLEVKLNKDAKDISFDRHIEEQKEQGYHLSSSNINTIDHEHTSIFVINKTRTALLMVEGCSEHEELFSQCGLNVEFNVQSTKKFDFSQQISAFKSFTLTNISGDSCQERDTCILSSSKSHRSDPPIAMKQIIIDNDSVHHNFDVLLFSENEGQFSLEVLSDVDKYTAFKIATSLQKLKDDCQKGSLEDVLEFLHKGEIKTDFIKPSNTHFKIKSIDKDDNRQTDVECGRTKSLVSTNEPYRLGQQKEYPKKIQNKSIEYDNPEKFGSKKERHTDLNIKDFRLDRRKVPRIGLVKMKNCKVKQVTPPPRWKIYLRNLEIANGVGEYFGMNIPSFKRPSVPWQTVNRQSPISYKLRFLDENH